MHQPLAVLLLLDLEQTIESSAVDVEGRRLGVLLVGELEDVHGSDFAAHRPLPSVLFEDVQETGPVRGLVHMVQPCNSIIGNYCLLISTSDDINLDRVYLDS